MSVPLYQVDAFAERAFEGNPAAVVVLARDADAGWMQSVAAEMNLSETAFVVAAGEARWSLRWFTPAAEVPLCGHATLATAHVLYQLGRADADAPIRFASRSGELWARRLGDGRIELDLPETPTRACEAPAGLAEALGARARAVRDAGWCHLAEVASVEAVRRARPDFRALAQVGYGEWIVTAADGDGACDFVSRFFGPGVGIDEDPVTGSAHTVLGPYWAERLGKTRLRARQLSARGGAVDVRLAEGRVFLAGAATTVLEARLLIDP